MWRAAVRAKRDGSRFQPWTRPMAAGFSFPIILRIKARSRPMSHEMFSIPIPILEKIIRPIIVYFALIILLRVFGKRELAQLNPFDLVVLLSLSNTVQNAIIGNDNSISGGIIGAATLLTINWMVVRVLYSSPRLNRVMGGVERTLITD